MLKSVWQVYARGAVEEKPDPAVVRENTLRLRDEINALIKQENIKHVAIIGKPDTQNGTVTVVCPKEGEVDLMYRLSSLNSGEQAKFVRPSLAVAGDGVFLPSRLKGP